MAHNQQSEPDFIKDLYKEINMRMLDCIEKDKVPYLKENPLPQDINVVNGRHFGDINKIQLDLKAAQLGAKSLKWIYKADADFIGLKLKNNIDINPLTVYANINRDGLSTRTESQSVYLLDQFTDESVKDALELTRTEGKSDIEIQKRGIAENMIRNISEYDAGVNEFSLRENKRKNISNNLKNQGILKEVSEAYKNVTQFYDANQKLIFEKLSNYFIRQETGLNLSKSLSSSNEQLKNALEETAKVDSPRLSKTLADCFLYSQRLTHFGFSVERIYTKEDLDKNLMVHSPVASQFKPEKVPMPERKNDIERILEREKEIKPRHITHQRGL
ncbi:hypothetical protein [Treponema pectinovorum]|uniref:hypothetical protein n=1 Tax=Treponema pectinovorum TaxID=164 RepID=UPI0011F25ECF|nr:hypothetical protein [Treponema pectinovorum]